VASRRRAQEAGTRDVGDLATLVRTSDAIVSVCPPAAALDLAQAVSEAGFTGTYLDANAVSPMRAQEIAALVEAAGARFVDGGIVGGPPSERGTTWLHLAGPDATRVVDWFSAGPLETNVVGDRIGDASALKACFAAWTKGRTARDREGVAVRGRDARDRRRHRPGRRTGLRPRPTRRERRTWLEQGCRRDRDAGPGPDSDPHAAPRPGG
jgi:3-hydroxyisobutyrate dehydrogenase-like beta-hydroxyacid dehydrogenase